MASTTFPLAANDATQNYENVRVALSNCASYCTQIQSGTAAGASVSITLVSNLWTMASTMTALSTQLQGISGAVTSLAGYMASIVPALSGESAAQVTALLSSCITALNALIVAIQKDYPVSGGFLADRTFTNGAVTPVNVTAAQLPNTMPAIAAFLATVS